ncbi:unnamed protein product, partial [Rotaria sp. Silwood1]
MDDLRDEMRKRHEEADMKTETIEKKGHELENELQNQIPSIYK